MSRSAWELASGGAKETGLSALFKGASLKRLSGEAVSVLAALKDKTVLLYFAAGWAKPCKDFNPVLSKFYDLVRASDDSIVVIFVSNDKSREEQLAFFTEGGMHPDWLMVEWSYDLEEIMENFNMEKIPGLIVVDRDGKAVVDNARDQVEDIFFDKRGKASDPAGHQAAVSEKWSDWRRKAGDWRASEGRTLGGGGAVSSSAAVAAAAGGSGTPQGATGQMSDREALRAARLAALERRMGGGGPHADLGVAAGQNSTSSASTTPAAAAADMPVSLGALSSGGGGGAAAGALASAAAASANSSDGPRVMTLGGGSRLAGQQPAAASSGSGTFASGAAGAPGGTVAYTLAGGRVELPPARPPGGGGAGDDGASDVALLDEESEGGESIGADAAMMDMEPPSMDEAVAQIVSMGFPEDAARSALQAAKGDIDTAVAHLLGDM